MGKDENKGSYAMIAIVAIVAIVGIVMMFMNNKQAEEKVTLYDSEGNVVGQLMSSGLRDFFANGGWTTQYDGGGGGGGGSKKSCKAPDSYCEDAGCVKITSETACNRKTCCNWE